MKVKSFLVLKNYMMTAYRSMEVKLHAFQTLDLNGGEWSVSHSS
jgi:hypothetical protein